MFKYESPLPKRTKKTTKRTNRFGQKKILLECPKSKEFQPPDLKIDFFYRFRSRIKYY